MATPNSLFVLFHVSDVSAIEVRLNTITPWLYSKIDDASWAIVAPNGITTQEVCDRLGLVVGGSSGIVARVDSYFGIAAPSLWEWLAAKQGVVLGIPTSV